ncbi:hypothetical protein C3K47_14590 [Solitalea longa]|uniref:Uncharacterized protein n=1 Tax=Solitalea longa TaxID=2079460 RepID=A0A2S4ZZ63_9SPHI|nr:hypothetical protein [Solitalea longa]POY35621.1 hypothetical protein C3K47_14590 [Solitalea longa]
MSKKITPKEAKDLAEKYRKEFGKPDRKLDQFDLPNSVKFSRADIEALLADEKVDEIRILFSIGEVEKKETKEKVKFLNLIATGVSNSQEEKTSEVNYEFMEASCPCPTIRSCCYPPVFPES